MVKHIIIWNIKEEYKDKKDEILADMKSSLEALVGKVPGLVDLKIIYDLIPSSTGDFILDSTLESPEALKAYATHPDHVKAADEKVRPFVTKKQCVDFEY